MKLTIITPEQYTLQYEQILFTVLGGIRLDGLDRLRVTLKIEFSSHAIRHNLDLYNDTQFEKLVRKTAERFEIGTVYINKAISHLTNELENFRLSEIKKQTIKPDAKKTLTPEETQSVINFLSSPDLLQRTNDLIQKSGVVGETFNRLIMYLIFTSRKTPRPLHIISFGSSGTGKSHLQEKVADLMPAEDKIEITSLSGNAFYYFDKDELGHKLILIEDYEGALAALYPVRELQSKQKISKTVTIKDKRGNTKTIHLTVYGPVSIAGCTSQERIFEDNANRCFLLYLDESETQDEQIMEYQRLLSAGKINQQEENKKKHFMQNVQRVLQPISVRNPFAESLKIPKEVLKPRRTNLHYLAFIEGITFYKQYQREQKHDPATGEIYIETTLDDIKEANALMKNILLRKSDELSGACRAYFEKIKHYLQKNNKKQFTNKETRKELKENTSNQKRYMLELQQCGHIIKTEGDQKNGYTYEVSNYEEYGQLQTTVNNVLDDILNKLKQTTKNAKTDEAVQQFKAVHTPNEPLTALPDNEKNKRFTETRKKRPPHKNNEKQNETCQCLPDLTAS